MSNVVRSGGRAARFATPRKRDSGVAAQGQEHRLFLPVAPGMRDVTGSSDPSTRRRRAWTRFAIFISFGGGVVAGAVGITGMLKGWNPTLYALAGASAVILIVANLLASSRFGNEGEGKPLPGDVYGDRETPKPHEVDQGSLNGRVPFSESKNVAKAEADPQKAKLYERLDQLNKELQRANVKLGLGELSREGYSKIVEELKERRARVEAKLNQSSVPEDF